MLVWLDCLGTLLEAPSPSMPTPLDRLQVTLWMPSEFREVHPSDFEGSVSEKSDGSWKVPNVSCKHAWTWAKFIGFTWKTPDLKLEKVSF